MEVGGRFGGGYGVGEVGGGGKVWLRWGLNQLIILLYRIIKDPKYITYWGQ